MNPLSFIIMNFSHFTDIAVLTDVTFIDVMHDSFNL